ncbi:MAG: hypothetical protein RL150_551 [Candidatus Parcubacteria bacterium]|jgi:hypothetical protein
MASKVIEWKALEHAHRDHSNEWYWTVGSIAIAGAILSLYFGNVILAILIVLSGFTAILQAHTPPNILLYRITRRGIQIGKTAYPYSSLQSFWVIDEAVHDRIILRSQKLFMPYIIIPFDSTKTDPDEIRDYLLEYLDEEEMEEPVLNQIMERLGF